MIPFSLGDTPLFAGLTPDEAEKALACLDPSEKSYPDGGYILRAGEEGAPVGLVVSGGVHIVREDVWGDRSILQTVPPGALFGESYACLPSRPLLVGAVAAGETRVLFFQMDKLLTVCPSACPHHTRIVRNLLGVLAGKNLLLTQKLDQVTKKTIRKKLMAYLSYEAERQGGTDFTIPYNRQELADYLAADRSALSAELGRMRKEGLLSCHKDHFVLSGAVAGGGER